MLHMLSTTIRARRKGRLFERMMASSITGVSFCMTHSYSHSGKHHTRDILDTQETIDIVIERPSHLLSLSAAVILLRPEGCSDSFRMHWMPSPVKQKSCQCINDILWSSQVPYFFMARICSFVPYPLCVSKLYSGNRAA